MYTYDSTTLCTGKSLATDFNSGHWDVRGILIGAIELEWSGADAGDGSLFLEGTVTGVNWCKLSCSDVTITVGAGHQLIEVKDIGVARIRIAYDAGANTAGTISAVAGAKIDRSGDSPGRGT